MTAAANVIVKVLGEEVARGISQLPTAAAGQPPELSTVVDAANIGRVRITYQLKRSPRRHANLWFWSATHAVIVPPADPS